MKTVVIGLLIPFVGTAAGAACVFFLRNELKISVQRALSGFAAGVMVAASIWSLIVPAIEQSSDKGRFAFLPAFIGFWLGILFLLLLDHIIPHLHVGIDQVEGPKSKLTRIVMLVLAVTLHNIPEGMAVGVVYAGLVNGSGLITAGGALALALGIAIQNFPEGAIISMPLYAEGKSKPKSFVLGVLSGAVEPLFGGLTVILAGLVVPAMPYLLSFAAGAISYLFPYITRALLMNLGEVVKEFTSEEIKALSENDLHKLGLRSDSLHDPMDIRMNSTGLERHSDKMILSNMRYSYKGEEPVFDISRMEIPIGETVAITGANGAGKSTFLRCLCGMERSCKATLSVGNEIWKNKKRRQSIYMVMQDVNHQLFTDSVLEEVMISQESENKEDALKILGLLDLLEYADKHPLALSGGQKQRVAVASAIAAGRDIILFDEPTSGLDYDHMLQVSKLLKQLREKGKTVIIVTHDVELIKNACTYIIPFASLQKAK